LSNRGAGSPVSWPLSASRCSRPPDNDESFVFRHVESVPTRYNPVTSIALLECPSGAHTGGTHNSPNDDRPSPAEVTVLESQPCRARKGHASRCPARDEPQLHKLTGPQQRGPLTVPTSHRCVSRSSTSVRLNPGCWGALRQRRGGDGKRAPGRARQAGGDILPSINA
jgi:hypothetical protein